MEYVIVSRYNDIDKGLTVSSVRGPFTDRKSAERYNSVAYPSPELNLIVPVYAAWPNQGDD